jgi:DNA-directed RNA polymerase subunit F
MMATESVDAAPDAVDEQRSRLEAELAAAQARKLAAQERATELNAHAKDQLRDELASSRTTLAEIERQHAETIADVRDSAQVHIDRILADAHRQAAVGAGNSEVTDVR